MFAIAFPLRNGAVQWGIRSDNTIRGFATFEEAEAVRQKCMEFTTGKCRHEVRELKLHVGDCPMTNMDPATRTSCVCEHWDTERDHLEGGGGVTVTCL